MVKWKYMYVTCNWNDPEKKWRTRYINGNELPDWTNGPTLYQVSDDLGEKGWELTGYHASDVVVRLVFKRPIE